MGVRESEERLLAFISNSAVVVLSSQIKERLLGRFSAPEVLLAVVSLHAMLSTVRGVPGFNASWRTLVRLMQSVAIQALAAYALETPSPATSALHALVVVQVLEFLPAQRGWVGDDLDSFRTNVTYIFADQLSALFARLGVPLFAAVLGLLLKGDRLPGAGLLGGTLAFASVTVLNNFVFAAISGGELSLVWPLAVLYFAVQITRRFQGVQALVDFGLFKASDAAYGGLKARGALPQQVALGLLLLVYASPRQGDPVWLGVCLLVLVQAGSDWFLGQVGFISATDPVLAALVIVTVVHFGSLLLDVYRPKG